MLVILIIITAILIYARYYVLNNLDVDVLKGDGIIIEEYRTVQAFNEISISGNIKVFILQDNEEKVWIKIDENLKDHLITETRKNVLRVYTQKRIFSDQIEVYISFSELEKIRVSESASLFSLEPFDLNELILKASTASNIELSGKFEKLIIDLNTSSALNISGETEFLNLSTSTAAKLNANDLKVTNCIVNASTASVVNVFVKDNLEASVSTGSTLMYSGTPVITRQEVSSGGTLKANN